MNNFMMMYQQFRQNPMAFMMQKGMNIPQNIMNDPNAIINQMMNTGQLNQQTYNKAQQIYRQIFR